tara:strand:- start:3345 stop:5186 length:1842 start_codon:yes stop_codon:yes gene_type:complete
MKTEIFNYPDGSGRKYVGEWKDGLKHGQGTRTSPDGGKYAGGWKNGQFHGKGIETRADGSIYAGEWVDGKIQGYGTLTFPNGDRFEGKFIDGEIDNKGIFYYPDGRKYEGDLKDGIFHGLGKQTYPDGNKYTGGWKEGKFHGEGTITSSDGSKYKSHWKDGIEQNVTSNMNTFCSLPWLHIQLKPNGQAKPCCRFNVYHSDYDRSIIETYNIKNNTLGEIMRNEFWSQIRADMENNKKVSGCHKCYNEEKSSGRSMRTEENRKWNNNDQSALAKNHNNLSFQYLELTTGRYCNSNCRSCSSNLSTGWEKEDKILHGLYYDRGNDSGLPAMLKLDFNPQEFENVSIIKMTGGEPMISPEFIPFLDNVIKSNNSKNIVLEIYTNCTWYPKEKIISRLKHFKVLNLFLSIDAYGSLNDYVRGPFKWDVVEKNMHKWLDLTKYHENFIINLKPTISLYNILHLPKMIEEWINICSLYSDSGFLTLTDYEEKVRWQPQEQRSSYTYNPGKFVPTALQTPDYLSPSLLPEKEGIINELEELCKKLMMSVKSDLEISISEGFVRNIDRMIGILNQKPTSNLNEFINYSADLDKLRNQDIRKSIPELWEQIADKVEYKGKL